MPQGCSRIQTGIQASTEAHGLEFGVEAGYAKKRSSISASLLIVDGYPDDAFDALDSDS